MQFREHSPFVFPEATGSALSPSPSSLCLSLSALLNQSFSLSPPAGEYDAHHQLSMVERAPQREILRRMRTMHFILTCHVTSFGYKARISFLCHLPEHDRSLGFQLGARIRDLIGCHL